MKIQISTTLLLTALISALEASSAVILDWDTVGWCFETDDCSDPLEFEKKVTLLQCFCSGNSFNMNITADATVSFCTNWEVFKTPQIAAASTLSSPATSDAGSSGGSTMVTGTLTPMDDTAVRNRKLTEAINWELILGDAGCGGGGSGDPHIKKWNGEYYDYHGECDLVLLSAPNFGQGTGFDLHIRTKIQYDYSYIESAALMIGGDVLEVSSYGESSLNGISLNELPSDASLSGHPVSYTDKDGPAHKYTVDLGEGNAIVMTTFKHFVNVKMESKADPNGAAMLDAFGTSGGLMGSFRHGQLLARDGVTIVEDPNEFGEEWQVQDSEPKLFTNTERSPQFPHKCVLPSKATKESRRLQESITYEDAEKACENWGQDKEHCIYDVMASGDMELALAGSY